MSWTVGTAQGAAVKYREIIADNLSKAGWSWGSVSAVGSRIRLIPLTLKGTIHRV